MIEGMKSKTKRTVETRAKDKRKGDIVLKKECTGMQMER